MRAHAKPYALLQRLRRNDAGRNGDGNRMGQIHAVQLVAGDIEVNLSRC